MMARVLRLYRGHRFLGGRGVAHEVRTKAEDLLRSNPALVVILDFSGVEGVSHSFADELLTPLSDLLRERMAHRVLLKHCPLDVIEELQLTASMHGLFMPGSQADSQVGA